VIRSELNLFAPNGGAGSSTLVGTRCHGCGLTVADGDRAFILDSAGVSVWHHDCYLEVTEIARALEWVQRRGEPAAQAALAS